MSYNYPAKVISNAVRMYYRWCELKNENPHPKSGQDNSLLRVDQSTLRYLEAGIKRFAEYDLPQLKRVFSEYPESSPITIIRKCIEANKPKYIDDSGMLDFEKKEEPPERRVERALQNNEAKKYEARLHYTKLAEEMLRPYFSASTN